VSDRTSGALVDLTSASEAAAAEVPPELLAQSLGQYLRGWWLRVRSGNSGVLPVVLAIVVVAVSFQIANSKFLGPQNLVNLFEQSTVYMVLAMAEIFALLLGEIDLSVGLVMGLSGVVVAQLVQPGGADWPWWAAILAAIASCAAVGAIQGTLVARLKMPSFIVTLGGLLILEGAAILVLGKGLVGIGNSRFTNEVVLYDIFWGRFSPVVGWILLAALVGVAGTVMWRRDARRRRDGLEVPPRSLVVVKIALTAAAGTGVVAICNVNRAHFGTIEGVPYIIPIVLVVLGASTLLLQQTRFGRYVYAIGGNPEAAELAGVNTRWVIMKIFMLMGLLAAVSGAISIARLDAATNSEGTLAELLVIAAAVIGGTSLAGGVGTVAGAMLGAVLMQSLQSGMVLLGVDTPLQNIVVGVVLVLAAWLDVVYRRRVQ